MRKEAVKMKRENREINAVMKYLVEIRNQSDKQRRYFTGVECVAGFTKQADKEISAWHVVVAYC